jgi:hypothetical protein
MTTNPTNYPSGYGPKGNPGYPTSQNYIEHRRKEATTEAVLWTILGLITLGLGVWWFMDEDPGIHQRTFDFIQNGIMFVMAMLIAYHVLPRRDLR